MEVYKNLHQKGYLKGDKFKSPISLNGAIKLASLFKKDFTFIDIIFVHEKNIIKEFEDFYAVIINYIRKYNFINEKLKNPKYSSEDEDKFFEDLKKFNEKYKEFEPDSNELYNELSKDFEIVICLLDFYNQKERISIDLMCKSILRMEKKADLNFFVWVDEKENHYSLVTYIGQIYYFIDSCSNFFCRWPNETIISTNENNNNNNLYNKNNTYVMMSFLQLDSYNCVSFVFAFIDILIELYLKFSTNGLINYLGKYFGNVYNGLYHTEAYDINEIHWDVISLYLLPEELLSLAESKFMLKNLLKKQKNSSVKIMIKRVIEKVKKKKVIKIYRQEHLKYLMNN